MRLESQLAVIDGDDFKFFPFLNSVRLGVLPDLPVVSGAHCGQESIVQGSKRDAAVFHENGFEQLARTLFKSACFTEPSARGYTNVLWNERSPNGFSLPLPPQLLQSLQVRCP